ncbi:MAG: hypothetical protein IPM29_01070 [Planctomycetes bacterium]|nr:hypothetical protein [Planctomycetota bacterium]
MTGSFVEAGRSAHAGRSGHADAVARGDDPARRGGATLREWAEPPGEPAGRGPHGPGDGDPDPGWAAASTSQRLRRIALPLVPAAVSCFLISALLWRQFMVDDPSAPRGSALGRTLAALVNAIYDWFGLASPFMAAVLTLAWSAIWYVSGRAERVGLRIARIALFALCLAILLGLETFGGAADAPGQVGRYFAARFAGAFGDGFAVLLLAPATLAALLLATDYFFYRSFEALGVRMHGARRSARQPVAPLLDPIGSEVGTDPARIAAAGPGQDRSEDAAVEDAAVEALRGLRLARDLPAPVPEVALDDADAAESASPDVVAVRDESAVADEFAAQQQAETGPAGPDEVPAEEPSVDEPVPSRRERRLARMRRRGLLPDAPVDAVPVEGTAVEDAPDDEVPAAEVLADETPADGVAAAAVDEPNADAVSADVLDSSDRPPATEADRAVLTDPPSPLAAVDALAAGEPPAVIDWPAAGDAWVAAEADEDGWDEFVDGGLVDGGFVDGGLAGGEDASAAEMPPRSVDAAAEPVEQPSRADRDAAAVPAEPAAAERAEAAMPTAERAPPAEPADEDDGATAAEVGSEPVVALPRAGGRQGRLFALVTDDQQLMAEARRLVTEYRRASRTFLSRRLRVSPEEAEELLVQLAAQGVLEYERGAAQGRVRA